LLPQHKNEVLVKKKSIAALLASLVVAVGLLAAACGGLPGNAVAKVGDVYIDKALFDSQLANFASQYGISQASDPATYQSLSESVLESLVATELAVQKASSLGVSVTDAEIQANIDSIISDYYSGDQTALATALASESMTMDDLKKQIKEYLLVGKVRDQVIKDVTTPSDEEIATYYEANKADYLTDPSVDARHILVAVNGSVVKSTPSTTTTTTATAEATGSTTTTASTTTTTLSDLAWARALATAAQIRADLLSGGSWSRLASRYSADLDTKNNGGSLGTVTQGSLTDTLGAEFDSALFSLGLDQISEPLKTANGYEIIQVTKITEPRQKTLEEAKADVSAVLLTDAQDAAWQAFLDGAKKEIKVVYRDDLKPAPTTTIGGETSTTTTP
jgi:foldase protein PrsA